MNRFYLAPRSAGVALTAALCPADPFLWSALAAVAALVMPWSAAVGVGFPGIAIVAAVFPAALLARGIILVARPDATSIHTLVETGAALVAYGAIFGPISYLCARSSYPVIDAALQATDHALGFDWSAWAGVVSRHPALRWLHILAYDSLLPQSVAAVLILPRVKGGLRGFTLIRTACIAALFACFISHVLPAAMPRPEAAWHQHWEALRSFEPFTVRLDEMQGIVTFPSFHAAMAVILAYSLRGIGAVSWAFIALNLAMLFATPVAGFHYLTDVLAGIATGIGSIVLCQALNGIAPLRSVDGPVNAELSLSCPSGET